LGVGGGCGAVANARTLRKKKHNYFKSLHDYRLQYQCKYTVSCGYLVNEEVTIGRRGQALTLAVVL
jgi:hypothetical protein